VRVYHRGRVEEGDLITVVIVTTLIILFIINILFGNRSNHLFIDLFPLTIHVYKH
jgi:hypothetical protein